MAPPRECFGKRCEGRFGTPERPFFGHHPVECDSVIRHHHGCHHRRSVA
jgi:hypothetical protein